MFARIVEFNVKSQCKHDFVRRLRDDVLPQLKRYRCYDLLPLGGEMDRIHPIQFLAIEIWAETRDAQRYEEEYFPKVKAILEPFLTGVPTVRFLEVEGELWQHRMVLAAG